MGVQSGPSLKQTKHLLLPSLEGKQTLETAVFPSPLWKSQAAPMGPDFWVTEHGVNSNLQMFGSHTPVGETFLRMCLCISQGPGGETDVLFK